MSRNVSFNFARYLTSGQEKISLPITTEATWRPVMPDDLSGYHQHGLTRTGEQKDLTMSRRKRKVIQAVCGLQEEYHDVEKLELIILEHVDSDNKDRMKEIHF